MPASPEFVAHCLDLLAPLGMVRTRRMFGGHGLWVDGLFVALIAGEQLFLKADLEVRPEFERAGCAPFNYARRDGRRATMAYWSAPDQAMESPAMMLPWARLAVASALRAANAKGPAAPTMATATNRPPRNAPRRG